MTINGPVSDTPGIVRYCTGRTVTVADELEDVRTDKGRCMPVVEVA